LLGADRAIVTPIPGTTRDVIEDSVQLGPYALVLNDTAGVRESVDAVEKLGIERTIRSARDADLLLAMFDTSRPLEPADLDVIRLTADRAGLAILNKRDLPAAITASDLRDRGLALPILSLSAINLADASVLRAELTKTVASLVSGATAAEPSSGLARSVTGEEAERSEAGEGAARPSTTPSDQIVISRERHRDALATALGALKNAHHSALSLMPPEIVAVDIMAAASALGSITGEVSSEDVLDAIFRDFCIGK
jgi:tRNA modification GTPase